MGEKEEEEQEEEWKWKMARKGKDEWKKWKIRGK